MTRDPEEELVEETEAFLTGRMVDLYRSRSQRPPVWTWTNALAHGDERQLRELALRPPSRREPWAEAQSYLATKLLEVADSTERLREVQEHALQPLELMLGTRYEVHLWRPGELISVVCAVLASASQNLQ